MHFSGSPSSASPHVERERADAASLPFLDDATMLWRSRMLEAPLGTDLDSPRDNPGFPRALSDDPARRASIRTSGKKKRVSFGSSTVYDE
jgi:hypothetical protein